MKCETKGNIVTTLEAATVWPIAGPITQEFGHPNPPYQSGHTGIDIAGSNGGAVTPFMAGKVIGVGNIMPGCGICVMVDHGHGITSHYAHLSRANAVVGQDVKPGDVIGYEGSTGWATGPHVHFEIQVMKVPVNPREFMVGLP